MKKQMPDNKIIANHGNLCSKWALENRTAMETARNAPCGCFSKYSDFKEDAWESVLAAVIPGMFSKLSKNTCSLTKNS